MKILSITKRTSIIPKSVALLHADGALPNLALMRLSTYFRERGCSSIRLIRPGDRRVSLFSSDRPACFGSSIFKFSTLARARLEREWAPIQWGGTGTDDPNNPSSLENIDPNIDWDEILPDYSLYPDFPFSIGFTQRGCRMKCPWCVVPWKEGAAHAASIVDSIWRGPGHPKKLILLDNDPFYEVCPICGSGVMKRRCSKCHKDVIPVQPWRELIRGIKEGGYKVSFSQGINIRLIDDESAAALASIEFRDNEFQERVLYTAWDNLGDEQIFREGVSRLERAGIAPRQLRVYMLIGFAKNETFRDIIHRFKVMAGRLKDGKRCGGLGCEPYPMIFDINRRPHGLPTNRTLKHFQRWVIRGLYRVVRWGKYNPHIGMHLPDNTGFFTTGKDFV